MSGVVLLGHRGFVGSAIATYLRSIEVDFVGVDRENAKGLRGARTEVLINAGGSSDRRLATLDPIASFDANVKATLDTILDFPAERFVHLSSIAVYEDGSEPARNREDAPIDPTRLSPYGFLKYLGELVVRRHARQWVVLRLGPLVGPGLRKNSIYDLLERKQLFFDGDSTMPYIDTRAVAPIVWKLHERAGETFNLCGRGTVRLADIAKELGVALPAGRNQLPLDRFNINIDKLLEQTSVRDSRETVLDFAREWSAGLR